MPVIVHWNFNHFLVVEGFGKDRVYLNDPATGRRTVTTEEFDRAFTGVVLTFEPDRRVRAGGHAAAAVAVAARAAARRARRGGVPGAGRAGPGVARARRAGVRPGVRRRDPGRRQARLAAGAAGRHGARPRWCARSLTWLQRRYLLRLLMRLAVGMSSSVPVARAALPIAFFAARSPGDLASRVQLNDQVATLLSGRLAGVVLDLMLVVFYAALMAFYDPADGDRARRRRRCTSRCCVTQQRGRTDDALRVSVEARQAGRHLDRRAVDDRDAEGDGRRVGVLRAWAGHQAKLASAQQRLARRDQLVGRWSAPSRASTRCWSWASARCG